MASPLENLVAQKQLKVEASTPAELSALLNRAAGLLTDAGNKALGPVSRFSLAYDAAFALATAALRICGYRADAARGHRAVVFQVLPHTLNAPAELWTALSGMQNNAANLQPRGPRLRPNTAKRVLPALSISALKEAGVHL